jgi:uncharacterized protein (TIGR02266 family)
VVGHMSSPEEKIEPRLPLTLCGSVTCFPASQKAFPMEPASALLRGEETESPGQEATSKSGARALQLPGADSSGAATRGPQIRGIVITSESIPEVGQDGTRDRGEPGTFQVEFAHDTQFFAGLSGDVSRGGILVVTYRELPIGTAVHLGFELPKGVSVEARGEVRWIREDSISARRGLAIAFTEVSVDALMSISEFCRMYPPLFLDLES